MKIIPISIFFSIILLSCSSQKPVIRSMNCIPTNFAYSVGKVMISSYEIANNDSLNLFIANSDSLIKKIIYPEIAERAGIQGEVTIKFKLDSSRVAKNIEFINRLGAGIEEAILKGLANFEFKFVNETKMENLNGMLTFSFKLY